MRNYGRRVLTGSAEVTEDHGGEIEEEAHAEDAEAPREENEEFGMWN